MAPGAGGEDRAASLIRWTPDRPIVILDVGLRLADVIAGAAATPGSWIVLERRGAGRATPCFYAYLLSELQAALQARPAARDLPALAALNLHETGESRPVPVGTTSAGAPRRDPAYPSADRVVAIGSAGLPVEVGQIVDGPSRLGSHG